MQAVHGGAEIGEQKGITQRGQRRLEETRGRGGLGESVAQQQLGDDGGRPELAREVGHTRGGNRRVIPAHRISPSAW